MDEETYEALKRIINHSINGGPNDKAFWDDIKAIEDWIEDEKQWIEDTENDNE